uniref:Putative exonuclease n=1 Tax=viral metagenome TaxID=1070528 RepID=A0A6M3L7B5_9ZZZZ
MNEEIKRAQDAWSKCSHAIVHAVTTGWHGDKWQAHRKTMPTTGASSVPSLVGDNPYAGPYSVWAKTKDLTPPFDGNDRTRRGHEIEYWIRREAARRLGCDYISHPAAFSPKIGTCREIKIIFGNPNAVHMSTNLDGLIWPDEDALPSILECKSTDNFKVKGALHSLRESGKKPSDLTSATYYWAQTQSQMACLGWNHAYLAAVVGSEAMSFMLCKMPCLEKDWYLIRIPRDDDYIALIERKTEEFWDRFIIGREVPPLMGRDWMCLKDMYAQARPGSEMHLSEVLLPTCEAYYEAKQEEESLQGKKSSKDTEARASAKRRKNRAWVVLMDAIKTCEVAHCGPFTVKWYNRSDGRVFVVKK